MKLVKTVTAIDLAAIQCHAGWEDALDTARVHKYQVSIRKGRALPPLSVSSAGCQMLDGFHRLRAYQLEKVTTAPACVFEPHSIRDGRIFQLETNAHRRNVSPEETAELVELYREEEAERQREPTPSAIKKPSTTKSKSAKTRGRPKTPEGKAVERAARAEGKTPAAIRKRMKKAKQEENTDPVSAELLKPPPSLAVRLGRALVDLKAATEKLDSVLRDMEGVRPNFGKEDSRHAVIGSVAQARREAVSALARVEQAREFMSKINAAKYRPSNGAKHPPLPVKPVEVREGKKFYEDAKRPPEPPAPLPEPTETICATCGADQVADDFCAACGTPVDVEKKPLGLSDPPAVGLQVPGRTLRMVLVDESGNEMPYKEALAVADAAGVGGGPPEDSAEPEGGF